jgi:hypothetical protein
MPTPGEILEKVQARLDDLQPADAALVVALAGELQARVLQYDHLGLLAMSLCSARITAGIEPSQLVRVHKQVLS